MILKLLTIIFFIIAISGCTEKKIDNINNTNNTNNIDTNIMTTISISAEGFRNGERIPEEYTCDGKDISPALSWTGVPKSTQSIVLIMDDPGAAFVHWVIFNIPVIKNRLSTTIPKNGILDDGSMQGMTDFRNVGYGGPCPPPGKSHKYYFRIYALDKILNLSSAVSRKDVDNAMKGHVLAKGELVGIYGR